MLRATFPNARNWHTILSTAEVKKTINITVPRASGYVLTSKKTGQSMGIADLEYVQREVFKQIPKQNGKLIIALTHNTAYYAEGDATICCLWGTHGSDAATGNSFVLASYLSAAPSVVKEQDVQPLTEQLAEFINDPLHDPLIRQQEHEKPGNRFPPWMRPRLMHPGDQGRCGGTGVASAYFLLEPTDTNHKNNFPYSTPFVATDRATYHVENVALLPWYVGASGELSKTYSFPDTALLKNPAQTCPARRGYPETEARSEPGVQPQPTNNKHKRPRADRLLERQRKFPPARCLTAMGHHHCCVCNTRPECTGGDSRLQSAAGHQCEGVEDRYRSPEKPGEESDGFAGRRRSNFLLSTTLKAFRFLSPA